MSDFVTIEHSLAVPNASEPSVTIFDALSPANLQLQSVQITQPLYERATSIAIPILLPPVLFTQPRLDVVYVPRALTFGNKHLGSQLLYRAATGLERAFADVDSERITTINAELIRAIWDPWQCPAKLLAYLAWANSVEFWNDDWSETTKRAWIAVQFLFKSLRGTRRSLEMAVSYAGRDVSPFGYHVVDVTTAPKQVFSGPSLTRDQREDWLQKLPQVRVWRRNEVGFSSEFKAFYGSSAYNRLHSRRFCIDGPSTGKLTAPTPSTAIERLKRVARWVEHGVETDVRVTDFGSFFQLHKSGLEDGSVYSNKPFGLSRHYIPSTARNRLITINPTPTLPWRSQMTPSLQAVTSEPERVKVSGLRKQSVFSNTPIANFFVPTTAPYRIFQRYAVLDPTIRQLRRAPIQFMGVGRYGFPAFTAWAKVTITGKLHPKAAGFEYWVPKTKFYIPHNGIPLERVRQAVQSSKSLRDKILLEIGPTPRFLAGERPVLAGIDTVPAGSI